MSYKPARGSLRDLLCAWIAENAEGITSHEATKRFEHINTSTVTAALFTLKHFGALVEDDGVYQLSNKLKPHYGIEVEEQPAPVELPVCAFKPWTGKYDPKNALRREPIREDVRFLNGSSGFAYGFRA